MPKPVLKPAPVAPAGKATAKPPGKAPTPKALIDGIPVWSLFDELMPRSELEKRKHPRNDNQHDDLQKLALSHIIRGTGIRKSITLSRLTGRIVAGHGALEASALVPLSAFPIAWQDFDSEEKEIAHLMADNELARMSIRNDMQTAENLDLLSSAGFDLALVGILDSEREDLMSLVHPPAQEETTKKKKKGGKADVDSIDEVSDELPGAAALKTDMLFMPCENEYDVPDLKLAMCMEVPTPFDSWAGPDGSPPQEGMHYLYNITSVMRELPIDRSLFGFYADDHRFEVVWNQPDRYAAKLLNSGFMGAVTPNFSLYAGAPYPAKLWSIYRSRWVGRFFQEAGIKVIPDVQTAGFESLDYCLAGIPVGVPAICIQFQTSKKTEAEVKLSRAILAEVEQRLQFKQIIIYGGDHAEKHLDGVFKNAEPIHILNRMQKRRGVIKKNASAAAKL